MSHWFRHWRVDGRSIDQRAVSSSFYTLYQRLNSDSGVTCLQQQMSEECQVTFLNFADSLPYFCTFKIMTRFAVLSSKCTIISNCRCSRFVYGYMISLITNVLFGNSPGTFIDSSVLKFSATYFQVVGCTNFSPFSLVISCKVCLPAAVLFVCSFPIIALNPLEESQQNFSVFCHTHLTVFYKIYPHIQRFVYSHLLWERIHL